MCRRRLFRDGRTPMMVRSRRLCAKTAGVAGGNPGRDQERGSDCTSRAHARRGPAGWGTRAHGASACVGQADGPRASRAAAGPRLVRGARCVRDPSRDGIRPRQPALPRRRRCHRTRNRERPAGLRLQPGLHGLRRIAVGGLRREDLQDHGPRDEGRRPDHRPQRFWWRPHPGRRRVAGRLRGDLPAQRHGLRGGAADLRDPRPVRGRRGLLAGHDRLHGDGGGDELHVRHRAQRREIGDARGGGLGVTGRSGSPHRHQRRRPSRGARRGRGS